MSEKLGPVALAQRDDGFLDPAEVEARTPGGWRPYSEETARLIDAEVRRVLDESYADALRLLGQRRHELDGLAEALLEHESLDEQEILQVTGLRPEKRSGALQLPMPAATLGRNGNSTRGE
jgi:cell division protease FtsH